MSAEKSARDNLPLKFITTLSMPFHRFNSITIRGYLNPKAKAIVIAFKPKGHSDMSALDIEMDVKKSKIRAQHMVRNQLKSLDHDPWYMNRYRAKKSKLSIEPGKMFHMQVIDIDDMFCIVVNDQKILTYEHLIEECKDLSEVEIRGDVDAITQFDYHTVYPHAIPATQYLSDQNVFSYEYPHLLHPGMLIVIDAICEGPSDGMFIIYFPSTFRLKTLLWLGVDFAKKTIGRRTMNANFEYEREVTSETFPFKIGEVFRIVFGFTTTHFVFAVNGEKIPAYAYPCQSKIGEFNAEMFNSLLGFKVLTKRKLVFKARAVFNQRLDKECSTYDVFSKINHKMIV